MAWFADADVQLLSDKWRSTVQTIVLTMCVSALGAIAFTALLDWQIIAGTLLLLFLINRKALGLDLNELTKTVTGMRQKNNTKMTGSKR